MFFKMILLYQYCEKYKKLLAGLCRRRKVLFSCFLLALCMNAIFHSFFSLFSPFLTTLNYLMNAREFNNKSIWTLYFPKRYKLSTNIFCLHFTCKHETICATKQQPVTESLKVNFRLVSLKNLHNTNCYFKQSFFFALSSAHIHACLLSHPSVKLDFFSSRISIRVKALRLMNGKELFIMSHKNALYYSLRANVNEIYECLLLWLWGYFIVRLG